jgi:hypothetical protein
MDYRIHSHACKVHIPCWKLSGSGRLSPPQNITGPAILLPKSPSTIPESVSKRIQRLLYTFQLFVFVDPILSHSCVHIMRHTLSTHNAIAALIGFGVVQRLVQCPMLVDDRGKIDRHNPVFADCYGSDGFFDKSQAKDSPSGVDPPQNCCVEQQVSAPSCNADSFGSRFKSKANDRRGQSSGNGNIPFLCVTETYP